LTHNNNVASARAFGKSADLNAPLFGGGAMAPFKTRMSEARSSYRGDPNGDPKDVASSLFSGYQLGSWNTRKLPDNSNRAAAGGDSKDVTASLFSGNRLASWNTRKLPDNANKAAPGGDNKDIAAPLFSSGGSSDINTHGLDTHKHH
jgi:hypothetical protein